MSWLSSFLHPERGYQAAQDQLQQFYDQGQSKLQPYNQAGMDQYGNLKDIIANFMNPSKLNDSWLKDYTESQSAKNAEDRAGQHGLDAASSMGLLGSNTALNAIQSGQSQIGADAQQSYLDNMMKKYLAGANLASGIFGQGANAASGQSNNAMNMGTNMAQMDYNKQNAGGNMFGGLLGLGGSILGSALGGPMGGALAKRWNLSGGA